MSKIDNYNLIRDRNQNSIRELNQVLQNRPDGTPNPNNDKGQATFYDQQIWDSDVRLYLHMSYGFYGSSSGYSVGDENIKKYILNVLNSKTKSIISEVIELMKKDIEKAKRECKSEAEEILKSLD